MSDGEWALIGPAGRRARPWLCDPLATSDPIRGQGMDDADRARGGGEKDLPEECGRGTVSSGGTAGEL